MKPYYDLLTAKRIVAQRNFSLRSRALRFLMNRYGFMEISYVAQSVFLAIKPENYYKTVELAKAPGIYADVYTHVYCPEFPEEEFYIKFACLEDETTVDIWSMNWDGYLH